MTSTPLRAVDEMLEERDPEATRQRALGQVQAIESHASDALRLLDELRLVGENLRSIHADAMQTVDQMPAYDVLDPTTADGRYADMDLSEVIRNLLQSFGSKKVADLIAGVDATQAAVTRYATVARQTYEAEWGQRTWESLDDVRARLRDSVVCPDCGHYRDTPNHEFGCKSGAPDLPPPASGDFECCASGSCEVCNPGAHR